METIRHLIEHLVVQCGVTGYALPIVTHSVMVVLAVFLAWLSDFVCRKMLIPLAGKITSRTATKNDDILLGDDVLLAACHIVPAIVIWKLLPMVFHQFPDVQELLSRLTAIYITLASMRLCLVFIESIRRLDTPLRSSTQQYIQSFCGVLKIAVVFVGIIVIIAIAINRSPLTLFAGLGATSAILMLVFKETIEGLVAGIRLTSADMLHVGDWITVPSTPANGTVEEMSLTTVKIRNFDNTIVTISPTTLVNGTFQNWKGMQQSGGRRVNRKVYFDFRSIHFVDDSQQETNLSRYRHDIETWLAGRDDVNTSLTLMVRQLEATQCGLPLEFYFFLKEKQWTVYEHQLADIMEHAYAVAAQYGLKIYQQYSQAVSTEE